MSDEELKRKAKEIIIKGCQQNDIILKWDIPTDNKIKNKEFLNNSIFILFYC